ncbi:MAG: o-succinylbenzoate synthase [Bacteroidaceae bacterium]|nr:o-succinylbenzoate synthase [Bacteroidaceae bacterium]
MQYVLEPYTLHFKFRAGTSRGTYTEHPVQFLKYIDDNDPTHVGIGEYAPLPDLSPDTASAMLFAQETALWHYEEGSMVLSDTSFSREETGIQINGLIWMGDYDTMKQRIEEKLAKGFRCVKLKIGAINFDDEVRLLKMIRSRFPKDTIELRVDANGAFKPGDDALKKLDTLAQLDLHSIEQPIRAGQWEEMAKLCRNTPLPIALDEELIPNAQGLVACGTHNYRKELLSFIHPQYIILKPSLHGGLRGCDDWISVAESMNIPWWATSALESNVGLNAIAHWVAQHIDRLKQKYGSNYRPLPQGLGTGQIYSNNIDGYPLHLIGDEMWVNAKK